MIFYLLICALFVFGLHRSSVTGSLIFAALGTTIGTALPVITIAALGLGQRSVAVIMLVTVVLGVAGLMSGRRWAVYAGAGAVGALVVFLLASSERFPGWYLMAIPAAMFAGTSLYRAEQRLSRWWWLTFPALALVFVLIALSAPSTAWVLTIGLAAGLFVLGMLLRSRRFPRFLVWLGLISYSIYVLHYILILTLAPFMDRFYRSAFLLQCLVAVTFFALVVGTSTLSYRYLEKPMNALGRTVAQACERRLGPDTNWRVAATSGAAAVAINDIADPLPIRRQIINPRAAPNPDQAILATPESDR